MRNHPLTIGEVVFDLNKNYFGVITNLENGIATIDMNGKTLDGLNIPCGWCEYENKMMMDCEITEDDLVWTTDDLDALYQMAWGYRDTRNFDLVCYEHQDFDDEYPFYSPYKEENLYNCEVEFC